MSRVVRRLRTTVFPCIALALCLTIISRLSSNNSSIKPELEHLVLNGSDTVIRSFPYIKRHMVAQIRVDKYKLTYCPILKNMFSATASIHCYLYDPVEFKRKNYTVVNMGSWENRECKDTDEFRSVDTKLFTAAGWHHLAIVREPMSRFISGFIDKCIRGELPCLGCRTDLTCFVDTLYEILLAISRNPAEKVDYGFLLHYLPQSWYCEFADFRSSYTIVKYSRSSQFYDDLLGHFRKASVPDDLMSVVDKELRSMDSGHTTAHLPIKRQIEQQIYGDRHLLLTILKMYYNDFRAFGFELPV